MIETGVVDHVLPEVTGVGALPALCVIEGDTADPLRRLACLLRDGQGGAVQVAERLRLSKADAKRLAALAAPAIAIAAGDDVRAQRRALYSVGRALFVDLVYLAWAAAPGDAGAFRAMLATAADWQDPALPVKGADVAALGVPAGPEVGRLLAAVETWWQDGDYRADRAATLEMLKALARSNES
jgi:poly(A) polymerase